MNEDLIIIIDDDDDDLEHIKVASEELKIENEIIIFNNSIKFLEYMKSTRCKTFLVLFDINMSVMDGLELKKECIRAKNYGKNAYPFVAVSKIKLDNVNPHY